LQNESRAAAYVARKGWQCKQSGVDGLTVETCPFCGNGDWKFTICASGDEKDGLWRCFKCDEKGNFISLKSKLGDNNDLAIASVQSMAMSSTAPPAIPPMEPLQKNLLENEHFSDVLDYLLSDRGFTQDVIEKMGLGAEEFAGKKWVVIPYFDKHGNLVYTKSRSVPPANKEFRSSAGREVPLYNNAVIHDEMDELIFVEGEADTLACLSNGIQSVVGVPGANVKKAEWIKKVDDAKPKKIYLLYDNDKVGQAAAEEMAKRLGIEKCCNILLPKFTTADGKPGKDINEWFHAGFTLTEFEALKTGARKFDVAGVKPTTEVLLEIIDDIENRGTQRWDVGTPWAELNKKVGGFSWGDVVGIIAEGKVGKTTMALNLADYWASEGDNNLFICKEMPQKNLVRKWVCAKMGVDDDKLTKDDVKAALEVAKTMPGDLLFGFTKTGKVEEEFELIRQAVRRYGVKMVVFDNLQFLVRSIEHSAQETSRVSKMFKDLAMELGIIIVLIIQPNRVREGEIVAARNANGSSAIEKDVDVMIALHRNRKAKIRADEFDGYMEADDNFDPQMLVRADLTRYAPGGVCTLMMDGAKSLVRSMDNSDRPNVPKVSHAISNETPTTSLVGI
jgi:KaiC/GvpD/RAD55 family RecA-like ATPase/5S rRNA maturation endonuclease (ribonuclease M5)